MAKRLARSFRVSPEIFRLALLLDAQRWAGNGGGLGLRSSIIKLLKGTADWWSWWEPSPLPVWTVRVYGIEWRCPQYMDAERLAAQIHSHHREIKGTSHWWCLYCDPARGGSVADPWNAPEQDETAD